MATRTHSVDPRAERVRTKLRDAAFALAHERPVDQLTVGDLVARAGVSRQVFYRHFPDRDDAVASAFAVAFAAATADLDGEPEIPDPADLRARRRAPHDVPQRRAQCGDPAGGRGVPRRTAAGLRGASPPARMPVVGSIAGLEPDAVSRFLVGGFQEVLRSWMEDPGRRPTSSAG